VAQQSPTTSPHVFGPSARLRAFSSGYRVASMTNRQLRPPKSAKSAAPGTAMPALRPHTCGVTGSLPHPRAPIGHGFTTRSRLHGPARPPLQGGLRRHRRRRTDDFAGRLHTRSPGKSVTRPSRLPWVRSPSRRLLDCAHPLPLSRANARSRTTLTTLPSMGSHSTLSPGGCRAVNSNTDSTGLICGVYRDGRRW